MSSLYFLRSDRGTGTGLKMSQGRAVNAAKNHSAAVISMQTENHPGGLHTTIDVFDGDPDTDCGNEAMAWFSTYRRIARTTARPLSSRLFIAAFKTVNYNGSMSPNPIPTTYVQLPPPIIQSLIVPNARQLNHHLTSAWSDKSAGTRCNTRCCLEYPCSRTPGRRSSRCCRY